MSKTGEFHFTYKLCTKNIMAHFVFHLDGWIRPEPECNGGTKKQMGQCCIENGPCRVGQGDCDRDSECGGNLVCGQNNCDQAKFFWYSADCCEEVGSVRPEPECTGGTKEQMVECCSVNGPCRVGQGDCDGDSECRGNLVCGRNNCDQAKFFWYSADCCEEVVRTFTFRCTATELRNNYQL